LHDKQAYQSYWSSIRYRGYVIDDICLLELSKIVKQEIIDKVRMSLKGEYASLDPVYVNTVIATTAHEGGFLLTPLDAVDRVNYLSTTLLDYRLLSTHISPVTIKERLRQAVTSESPGSTLFEHILSNSLYPLLPESTAVDCEVHERLLAETSATSSKSYIDSIYAIFLPLACEYLIKGYSRTLIYQTIRGMFYLYLRSGSSLGSPATSARSFPPLSVKCCKEEAAISSTFFRKEASVNYYEPLIYTRIEGISTLLQHMQKLSCSHLQDVHNVAFLEYADVYSKVVRVSNIRRRTILQDLRYLISEAVLSALRAIVNDNQSIKG